MPPEVSNSPSVEIDLEEYSQTQITKKVKRPISELKLQGLMHPLGLFLKVFTNLLKTAPETSKMQTMRKASLQRRQARSSRAILETGFTSTPASSYKAEPNMRRSKVPMKKKTQKQLWQEKSLKIHGSHVSNQLLTTLAQEVECQRGYFEHMELTRNNLIQKQDKNH